MKLLLAAATAAATLIAVSSASAQSMYGHGAGYGQSHQRPASTWRGSSHGRADWGGRGPAGYGASYGGYNRDGHAGYGLGGRDRDAWRRSQSHGPMVSRAYPSHGAGFATPFRRARPHW